jgi:hypothetical protein
MRGQLKGQVWRSLGTMVLVASSLCPLAARADQIPTADCLAASSASIRLDNEHRLRAERTQLLVCASASCPVDVRNECVHRVDEVNSAIPTIIFGARDGDGNDLSAVRVIMDTEVLTDRLQGIAIPIDPGVHTFIFEAALQQSVWKSFVILQGQKNRTELITFSAVPRPPSVDVASRSRTPDTSNMASPPAPTRDTGAAFTARQKWTVGLAAIGVVGLGLGTGLGWQARTKRDEARELCPGVCTDQRGVDRWQEAKRAGNFSTAAFVAGGIGIAGATLLWLTATTPSNAVADNAGPRPDRRLQVNVLGDSSRIAMAIGGRW